MIFDHKDIVGSGIKDEIDDLGIVIYVDDSLKIKFKSKLYEIIGLEDIKNVKILYSKPTNITYPSWTEKKVTKLQNPRIVSMYWSKYKPGMKLKGVIIDERFKVLS